MSLSGFDFYISNEGRLVIPSLSINYLVNIQESNLSNMPTTSESTARIAGKDGDILLSSTYEPLQFEIKCYTEQGLTQEQKAAEERKINNFLNSMKINKKTFAFEKDSKFYDVNYSGSLTTIYYPTHIEFTIPLKSSNPFGKALNSTSVVANHAGMSATIENVGAVFTINGPATNPVITFNDYEMEYENTILSGNKIVIDTNNSTVTHVTNQGVRTNAMMYYNHQFPKVINGLNYLSANSGVDYPSQVSVTWYDLIL